VESHLIEKLSEKIGRPLRVLTVASGGCNALSLLGNPAVESVDAVDINPAQLHLTALKRAAIEVLPLDAQFRLLGSRTPRSADERNKLYQELRPSLDEERQAYWDKHPEQIAYGINRVGRLEVLLAEIGAAFRERGIDPIAQPARALGCPEWNEIFGRAFERVRLSRAFGAAAVGYSLARSFALHYSRCFAHALRRFARSHEDNYFLLQAFHGCYAPERGAVPPYLLREEQEKIKELGTHRLHLLQGNFLGKMLERAEDKPYDLIQTSDLSDWMPVTQAHELFSAASRSLSTQGAVLARRLNGDHRLGSLLGQHLQIDAALSAELLEKERSFVYSEVVVGFQPAAA